MPKPNEDKSDGLEIISIGTLYRGGSWDKKYWSSSRGKDRYPYPVGYKAVRTHNGTTYKMEIHEGLKGPTFSITSTDGQSCSGQTPEIAWENFQKKGCPRIKLWHGKRFSCKIDGVEFFGFKNPFVQRLLRELVANVGGTVEQSSLPSSSGNGYSGTMYRTQCKESCPYPDLLPYRSRPHIKGKRSRKYNTINCNPTRGPSLKKLRPKDQMHNIDNSELRQGTQSYVNGGTDMSNSTSNEEHGLYSNNPKALETTINLATVLEGEHHLLLVKEGLPLESSQHSDHPKQEVHPKKESKIFTTGITGNLSTDDQSLDRSKDGEIQRLRLSMVSEEKDGEASVRTDTQNINDMDLCAPDSLDLLHDSTPVSQLNCLKSSPYSGKHELIAGNMVISEGPAPELQPQEVDTVNACSEKSDFDSVGQEIANSMMTVLLPRALPLLKTFSRKKKTIVNPSEISSCKEKIQKDNSGTENHEDVAFPTKVHIKSSILDQQEKEKMHILSTNPGSVIPIFGQNAPVIPDIKNDQSSPDIATAAEINSRSNTLGLPVNVDALDQSSICHVDNNDNKDIYSYNEGPVTSIGRPEKGDILISESALGCTPSARSFSLASSGNKCRYLDETFTCLEIHAKEKGFNDSPNYTEGTIDDKSTGLVSSVQVPHKGTNVQKGVVIGHTSFIDEVTSTRNNNCPLTESIISKSSTDGYTPDTYTAANGLLVPEIQPASSFNHNPHKSVSSCVDARLEGRPYSLQVLKITNNSNGILHNMSPVLPQNQAFIGPFNVNDKGKSHPYVDNEHHRNQKVDTISSKSWLQKQGTSFCFNSREVAAGSDLKPQMILGNNDKPDRIVELVGRYVHPLPVSLVLLITTENELYICVLCGVFVDKNRTLFMYKISRKEQSVGCPSLIGHTPMLLPTSRDAFGREIAFDRSGLQLTPDGQCLVLLKSIKAPYCREGKMQCPCSACRFDGPENNVIKIVQVKRGYVSVVTKLKTDDNIHCVLVCEPNYLVGVEETGRVHLWVMNSTWSAHMEEYDLSTSDCICPCIVELKRIPNCATIVVGHNGFGEFGLWDISKRTFIARFSSPSTSVIQFQPISLCRWHDKGHEDHINDILAATKISFLEQGENHVSVPIEGEDVAVWAFISNICNSDVQHDFQSSDHKMNPVGFWRLALLVKNIVILGSALDARATAISASAGHGIIGTCDGLVYTWELSTGTKVWDLHCFKDVGVSSIAIDDSRSGLLAVAGGDQLKIYLHSKGGQTS